MTNSNHKLANGQFLRITELYAFIAKDKEGNEGIMGFSNGGQMMPLIGADIDRVESLKPIADRIAALNGIEYELRYFTTHGEVAPSLYNK